MAADRDQDEDLYVAEAGGLQTILGGRSETPRFARISADGTAILIGTNHSLVRGDRDRDHDVYRLEGGRYSLVTNARRLNRWVDGSSFRAASVDLSVVFFGTTERLLRADRDRNEADIYVSRPAGLALVTKPFRRPAQPLVGALGTAEPARTAGSSSGAAAALARASHPTTRGST